MAHIHILGICGTFMGGVALIAKELGHTVSGSDQNIYPPMSDTLSQAGITILEGYDPACLRPCPDLLIVGNAISRGNVVLEHALNKHIPYTSGPQWLAECVLQKRHVLAVSGTHGKTTTSSMLAWILNQADLKPGYLIGGVPLNFSRTAALGKAPFFVVEADEYDTAFFDKRSKFLHYRPRTLIINNLEYDHADIFPDLEAIKKQFQYLLRTVPSSGAIIYPADDREIPEVISRGCWCSVQTIGTANSVWHARNKTPDGGQFELWHRDQKLGLVKWPLVGDHNILNALSAAAAAHEVGITGEAIIAGLKTFQGVKRRLEKRGEVNQISVYDDFAHHPTAIEATLSALRAKVADKRIVAVLQFGSNTMSLGAHRERMAPALRMADKIIFLRPEKWDINPLLRELGAKAFAFSRVEEIIDHVVKISLPGDNILIMSNKGFEGIHQRLLKRLQSPSLHANVVD
ncbi:MAG: UDP-N-acetylmuramate:L-alanyl-gamma-D-glutamyl-meso-diaminopimelate ligase [Proteobacteria bacterium]|nr:UDP-N-acetylmuramate:L-alanyl-gamma-D-glutamyl-meso-diaminopimelate ligase [Pseudomonadota bacterium]